MLTVKKLLIGAWMIWVMTTAVELVGVEVVGVALVGVMRVGVEAVGMVLLGVVTVGMMIVRVVTVGVEAVGVVGILVGVVIGVVIVGVVRSVSFQKKQNSESCNISALIGVLLDVSGSMKENAVMASSNEKNTSWARSIFEVVDGLIKHDVSDSNKVFAFCFGGSKDARIFDLLNTLNNLVVPDEIFHSDIENKVSHTLDILQKNGAPYVRSWADNDTIKRVASEDEINVILAMLIKNPDFRRGLVHDCLPSQCRDGGSLKDAGGVRVFNALENLFSFVRPLLSLMGLLPPVEVVIPYTTSHETKETIRKALNLLISKVNISNAVMKVKQASDILHNCLRDEDLIEDGAGKLLKSVEEFIYGNTPFWEAVNNSADVFSRAEPQCDQKLLFVLSDGEPTDHPNESLERLQQLGVTVVTLYITNENIDDPCRLCSEECPNWSEAAKLLFRMSSTLTTQSIPRTVFVKKGWKIDYTNNETKLFFQVNHPDLIKNVCSFARDVICCQDAMAEVLSSVSSDIRTYMEIKDFAPKEQVGGTCYANAIAAVMHMATRRIVHRKSYPQFETIRQELIQSYGTEGAFTFDIMKELCPKYRLKCQEVDIRGAMKAISANRPVVATFALTVDEWKQFSAFYRATPDGVLCKANLDIGNRKKGESLEGHAVVLTSYNSRGLRFMNSWGTQWADGGFFKAESSSVLALEFMDVFWTLDDLLQEEKNAFAKYGNEVASMLIAKLKGLQEATHKCPKCGQTSKVNEFNGNLFQAKCPRCKQTFDTKDTQNSLALSLYFTSLAA